MKIIIEGKPKEIAALERELKGGKKSFISEDSNFVVNPKGGLVLEPIPV